MSEGLTKKQIKELRKLEKMQSRNLEQKNSSVKWIAVAIVSALFLVMFVGIIAVAKNKNKPVTEDGQATFASNGHVRKVAAENEASPSASSKTLQLVEYADLQCPACRSYHPIVKSLLEAYPGQLELSFKHFPLTSIHPNAMDAAIASEAMSKQDKFFEFIDFLYEKQGEWAGLPNPDDKFAEYAKAIGADVEKYKEDLKDPAISKIVDDHKDEGIQNGVSGTPTFFLNGKRITSPANIDDFKKLVDEQLNSESNAPSAAEEKPVVTTAPDGLQLQE